MQEEPHGLSLVEGMALVSIFLMDIGWVSSAPSIALPTLVLALVFQAALCWRTARHCGFEMAHVLALLAWIIGNGFWMCGELIWDSSKPKGILSSLDFIARAHADLYPPSLCICAVILWTTAAGLLLSYVFLSGALTGGASLPPGDDEEGTPTTRHKEQHMLGGALRETQPQHLHRVPLSVYSNLFMLPWLIMDAVWVVCNYNMLVNKSVTCILTLVGVVAGLVSLLLTFQSMAKFRQIGRQSEAIQSGAEGLWVLGNMVWFLSDVWDHWFGIRPNDAEKPPIYLAIAIFWVGLALTLYSLRLRNLEKTGETAPLLDTLPVKAY